MPSPFPDNQRAAVSLTYDDGLACHPDLVAPTLEKHGLLATFYTPFRGFGVDDPMERPVCWRRVAQAGHELGNHSLFHPCRRTPEMGSWLLEPYDLKRYSAEQFRRELAVANYILHLLDGRTVRSYGNTCHATTLGPDGAEESMTPVLKDLFVAARGAHRQRVIQPGAGCDFHDLGCFGGDKRSFDELRKIILEAKAQGGWVIFCFHGVGPGTHKSFTDTAEHEKLAQWLGEQRAEIWTAPVADVATQWQAAL